METLQLGEWTGIHTADAQRLQRWTDPSSCAGSLSSVQIVSNKGKKKPFGSEHNTVKHPTGIPLTLSSIPKVEAAGGYGGTDYHNSQCHAVPQWGPNMARLPERPAEVVLQSKQELIIHLLRRSFKFLHYLFVLFSQRFLSGHLAEETALPRSPGGCRSICRRRVRETFLLII